MYYIIGTVLGCLITWGENVRNKYCCLESIFKSKEKKPKS